jgi:hypothetical protein
MLENQYTREDVEGREIMRVPSPNIPVIQAAIILDTVEFLWNFIRRYIDIHEFDNGDFLKSAYGDLPRLLWLNRVSPTHAITNSETNKIGLLYRLQGSRQWWP